MPIRPIQHNLRPDYQLNPSQVDLWRIQLDQPLTPAYEYLNSEERQRADRFQFPQHQRRFSNARAALKNILGLYLAKKAIDIQIQNHVYGKPYVNNHLALEFNLSHSNEYALLAVGQNHALGVDIEIMSSRPYHGIALNAFSNKEQKSLELCSNISLPFKFFTIWTQKEAFIKACGLGLRYPTQSFNVNTRAGIQSEVFDSQTQINWQMLTFMHQIGIPAALCCHLHVEDVRVFNFKTFDESHAK